MRYRFLQRLRLQHLYLTATETDYAMPGENVHHAGYHLAVRADIAAHLFLSKCERAAAVALYLLKQEHCKALLAAYGKHTLERRHNKCAAIIEYFAFKF